MKGKFVLLISVMLLIGTNLQAAPLGTAISYQGRLDDSGSPANGTYSFRFRLVSDPTGTTQVGPVVDLPNQTLVEGLLNAPLDFGASAFTGDARWLEISVKAGGPGAPTDYIKLNPQPLLPAPSSQFALAAGDVLNGVITGAKLAPLAITSTHISDGSITAPKLGLASITSGNVADNAVTAAKIASGNVVKSLTVGTNVLRDNITLATSGGVSVTANGNTLTLSSTGTTTGPWGVNGTSVSYLGGHVGIGTSTPTAPLHVNSGASASSILAALLEPNLVGGGFNQIYLGRTPTDNGCSTFTYTYDDANPTLSRLSLGLYNSSFSLNVLGNGNVGIGTPAPTAPLHVNSSETGSGVLAAMLEPNLSSGSFNQLYLGRTPIANGCGTLTYTYDATKPELTRLSLGLYDNSYALNILGNGHVSLATTDLWLGHSSRRGSPGRALVDGGSELHLNFNSDWANTIIGGNNVSVGTLTIRGGADLAEPFPMKEDAIEKGSVVVIDDEHPGRLKRSTEAYDTRVAGIVSGANGISPGIALKQEGALDQGENVALSGRVYVRVDATHSAVRPGDLLTTSDTPGYAMKVTDSTRAQGAILGKAMTALPGGRGMVLVLVTLQ